MWYFLGKISVLESKTIRNLKSRIGEIMRLMIFMCFAMSIMYAVGNVYDMHFKDMLSNQAPLLAPCIKIKKRNLQYIIKGQSH